MKLPGFKDCIFTALAAFAAMRDRAGALRGKAATVVLVLLCAMHLGMALWGVSSRWHFHHQGWNGARRSINARNYLRFGYVETRLAPLDNVGAAKRADGKPAPQQKYWHHPPGFALLLSVAFALLGDSETVARLFSVLLYMSVFLMLLYVFRRSRGDWETTLALLILTFTPIYAGYLNLVNFEPLVLFSMAACLFLYEQYRQDRRWWKLAVLALAVLVGAFSDYPVFPFYFYFWVVACVLEAREGLRRGWKLPVLFPLMVLAAGALLVLQLLGMKDSVDSFVGLYNYRHTVKSDTPLLFVFTRWDYYLGFFGPVTLAFSAWWLLDLGIRALFASSSGPTAT